MYRFINRNGWFFYPYSLLVLIAAIELLTNEKSGFIILLDTKSHPVSDWLFSYITNIGDGLFVVFLALVLLFIRTRWFLGALATAALTGIIIYLTKNFIFTDSVRPRAFLEGIHEIRAIENLNAHMYHSMPSGHTAAAFAIFSFLAFVSEKRAYGFVCLLAAAITGFSRMYLAQHFLEDVIAGSIIGIVCASACYYLFCKHPWLEAKAWANKPLIRI